MHRDESISGRIYWEWKIRLCNIYSHTCNAGCTLYKDQWGQRLVRENPVPGYTRYMPQMAGTHRELVKTVFSVKAQWHIVHWDLSSVQHNTESVLSKDKVKNTQFSLIVKVNLPSSGLVECETTHTSTVNTFFSSQLKAVNVSHNGALRAHITHTLGKDRDTETAARGNMLRNRFYVLRRRWILKLRSKIHHCHIHPLPPVSQEFDENLPLGLKPSSKVMMLFF